MLRDIFQQNVCSAQELGALLMLRGKVVWWPFLNKNFGATQRPGTLQVLISNISFCLRVCRQTYYFLYIYKEEKL